jgi:hypothetical protein
MTLRLETWLQEECARNGLDLSDKLARVKVSAREIWAEPRLLWFTDHGVHHSERIVEILGSILDHLQTTPQRLNSQELFVLLCAAYLHDIGMQDFLLDGRGMESLTIRDYELIRDRHPMRSGELIMQRTLRRERDQFNINLDDQPSYLVPIALVSQAHGSSYFETAVEELATLPHTPGGQPIRGGLLAALLLIGDELDLHEERARFPREMDFSPISMLHHHVHHYVAGILVRPGEIVKERQIALSLEYPSDSEDYASSLRSWLTSKLQRQLRRTATIVRASTQAELNWCPQIEVKQSTDKHKMRRPLPSPAQKELFRQLILQETVNYEKAQTALTQNVLGDQQPQVLFLIGPDEEAIAHMLRWLEVNCALQNVRILGFDFRHEPYSREDVLRQLVKGFSLQNKSSSSVISAPEGQDEDDPSTQRQKSFGETVEQCLEELASSSQPRTVICLQNLDLAETATGVWIGQNLLPRYLEHKICFPIVLTCTTIPEWLQHQIGRWETITLGNLSADAIENHLHRAFGFPKSDAREQAEAIYGTSNAGRPEGVLYALKLLRLKEVRLLS